MDGSYEANLDLAGNHRLYRPPANNKHGVCVDAVLEKEPLLLGYPKRSGIVAYAPVGKKQFCRRLCGLRLRK